jgi:hypothetical protein
MQQLVGAISTMSYNVPLGQAREALIEAKSGYPRLGVVPPSRRSKSFLLIETLALWQLRWNSAMRWHREAITVNQEEVLPCRWISALGPR